MQAALYALSVALGVVAAIATGLFTQGMPFWLSAILTGVAAMLPGAITFYVTLHRPLHQLAHEIRHHCDNGSTPSCRLETMNPRHELLATMSGAVITMRGETRNTMRSLSERGSELAIAAANLSFSADALRDQLKEQVQQAHVIGQTSDQISVTTRSMASSAAQAESASRDVRDATTEGQSTVQSTITLVRQVRDEAERNATTLNELQSRSQEIQSITQVINQVAEQTNLLALNAAIEAARAGEHGRGFAVVADEVRQLASKTTEATREIGEKLSGIRDEVNQSAATMRQLVEVVENTVGDAEQVGQLLERISSLSQESNHEIGQIAQAVNVHVGAINNIGQALGGVESALGITEHEVEGISDGALALAETAENEYRDIAVYELDTVHDRVRHIAQQTARHIGELFEQAIKKGQLSLDDLMDRNYQAIANTNPQKFCTRFDKFTDQVLPDVQEPILRAHEFILYAGAVDNNGYFPTHNRRYSQPLSGDYQRDLANNRTKRIFDDRTGGRCGSNTEAFLLQTYKRDTGEIMHDMSAPITVMGHHWGGFRIGYRSREG